MKEARKKQWNQWNRENPAPTFQAEETIEWLEGMRAFLFEVWSNDDKFKKKWELDHQKALKLFSSSDHKIQ